MQKTLLEKATDFLNSNGFEPMVINDTTAIWADTEPDDLGYVSIRSWHVDSHGQPTTADKFLTSWDSTHGSLKDFFEPQDLVLLAEKYV